MLLRPEGAFAWLDGQRLPDGARPTGQQGELRIGKDLTVRLGARRIKPGERLEIGPPAAAMSKEGEAR
ncbi:MAG: hypothetical protein ACK4N6_00260 [Rhodocyclaceae bacterium]